MHPYRMNELRMTRAPRAPRWRVAWSWARGRLMRYGRRRTLFEDLTDRAPFGVLVAVASKLACDAYLVRRGVLHGHWHAVCSGVMLITNLVIATWRRWYSARPHASIRARERASCTCRRCRSLISAFVFGVVVTACFACAVATYWLNAREWK